MIKYLEVPDMHYDPAWTLHSQAIGEAVKTAAFDKHVDFIAVLGDLFNRPLYASDKSRYNDLVAIIKGWLSVCPVVAIEGTPSHDGPGCYGPLEEVGLTLLRPGNIYTLRDGEIIGSSTGAGLHNDAQAILFGVPELNKNKATDLVASERAGSTLEKFRTYITEWMAPRRAMYPNVPAIGLLHGVVSDSLQEHEDDIIKQSSSLLIHTEILQAAGLDRWSLGDIHTPWESQRISAGYAGFTGIDDGPWGKRDFVPAMNLVEIVREDTETEDMELFSCFHPEISRIPYGTPERRKISSPLTEYDPAIAYWLTSETDAPELNPTLHGAHEWSRVTYEPLKTTTRRVTKEEAEKATTLSSLLQLMDPDGMTPAIGEKADRIDQGATATHASSSARLTRLTVRGCVFFSGKPVDLDASDIPRELTEIAGNDNGVGKSSLLSWATPYPSTIGKDTESGRDSAIHEFFTEKESYVEKVFQVGGSEHRHLLSIKGAHTQSPSVEAFLYIDGGNVLATKSFDEMSRVCEELYGPIDDYMLTEFNVQPDQTRNDKSLAGCRPAELRERVLRVTGIDRTQEASEANGQVKTQEGAISESESKVSALASVAGDLDELRDALRKAMDERDVQHLILDKLKDKKQAVDEMASELAIAKDRARAQVIAKDETTTVIENLVSNNLNDADRITSLNRQRENRGHHAERLEIDAANIARAQTLTKENNEIQAVNQKKTEEFRGFLQQWENLTASVRRFKDDHNRLLESIKTDLATAANIEDPCENCGHVSERLSTQAAKLRGQAHDKHTEAQLVDHKLKEMPEPIKPMSPILEAFEGASELAAIPILSEADRQQHNHCLREADTAVALIDEITNRISEREAVLADERSKTFELDPDAIEKHNRAVLEAQTCADSVAGSESRYQTAAMDAENKTGALKRATEVEQKIQAERAAITKAAAELADWKYLAAMLRPNKLPAFELDMVLDSIDERATRYITPFREGAYTFRTETQGVGKTGIVDRFSVLIHDGIRGVEKSLLKYSGGEKVFLADAYQKALLDVRLERNGVLHEPVIFDESDSAIRPERIAEYYQMQTDYFHGIMVWAVSHAPDASSYIQNRITMSEVLG